MLELRGKYNTCKVFTDNVDNATIGQLTALLNQESVAGSQIRIMPDTHAGAGCVIGTTMTLKDKVIPNLVGVDIGCGMLVVKLKEKRIDLPNLDSVIRKHIPAGFEIHSEPKTFKTRIDIERLRCYPKANLNVMRAYQSVGTLGGGNHFIEIDKDSEGNLYLVIHTGSRNLGKQVAEYYQDLGYERIKAKLNDDKYEVEKKKLIEKLKAAGQAKLIGSELEKMRQKRCNDKPSIPYELAYVEGQDFEDYIEDMKKVQMYAADNRVEIVRPDVEEDDTDKLSVDTVEKIPYTREDFEKDIKLPDEFSLDDLEAILKIKHLLLFTAPPGTGKTTAAIALANYILGEKESDRLTVMSFNQATEYSDIVSGLRQDKNGIWKNSNGTIKSVCTDADNDKDRTYIIVLDEINRGNPLAALGEYLTAMSQIGKKIVCNTGETIVMPENVYIIATMNTTDSSVTKLDAALRDRFAMIEMNATNFEVENIKKNIDGCLSEAIKLVISYIENVNKILAKDMIKSNENQLGMRQLYTDYNTVKGLILVVKTCIKPQIDAMSINLDKNDIDEIEKLTNILIKELGDIG